MPHFKKQVAFKLFRNHQSSLQLFALACGTNGLLAYTSIPLGVKIALFLLLVGIPFGNIIAFGKTSSSTAVPIWERNLLAARPSSIFLFFSFLLAASFRWFVAYHLTVWPIYDNGLLDYYAWKISQHWDHRLFYGYFSAPIGYLWILSCFHRLIEPSVNSFWLYSLIFSFIFLVSAYGMARLFFSKTFSFLTFFLMAFSFWPLLIETMTPLADLVLALECVAWAGLSAWHISSSSHRKTWAAFLGLIAAAGYYLGHVMWASTSVFLGFWLIFQSKKKGLGSFVVFSGIFLVTLTPLAYEAYHSNIVVLVNQAWLFRSTSPFWDRLKDSFSYITALFWGTWRKNFRFTSFWGGLWNPVLGSAIFLGIVEVFRFRRLKEALASLLSFGVLLLPGLLSGTQEMMRIAPILPIGLGFAAVGIQKVLSEIHPARRLSVLMLLLLLSCSLDAYQILGPYRQWQVPGKQNWEFKSAPKYLAYQILKKNADKLGPGWVFTEFASDFSGNIHLPDQTLRMACYPFNALDNKNLASRSVRWAAILVNADYEPFLRRRFPEAQWYKLAPQIHLGYGSLLLGIIPLSSSTASPIQFWAIEQTSFERINSMLLDYNRGSRDKILRAMAQLQPELRKDQLLESCLFEKIIQCFLDDGNPLAARQAIEQARKTAYPCVLWDQYLDTVTGGEDRK